MGIYLNPGSGKFKKAVNSKIYVDKTGLIEYTNSVLNTEQRYICISRPRRFGKTMTINITREFPAGKGYAAMLFIPLPNYSDKLAILVELKYGSDAETALNQIKERQYIAGLKGYRGKLLLVGISYSKDVSSVDYKKHECVIEEVEI